MAKHSIEEFKRSDSKETLCEEEGTNIKSAQIKEPVIGEKCDEVIRNNGDSVALGKQNINNIQTTANSSFEQKAEAESSEPNTVNQIVDNQEDAKESDNQNAPARSINS